MLEITIPAAENLWDPVSEIFISSVKETKLSLEHSLISLAKWESKWHVPFLSNNKLSIPQLRDYVMCMTITQNVDPLVYHVLTQDNLNDILSYIDNPMTATTINENALRAANRGPKTNEIVTNELIYFWMTQLNIPFDPCQKWHLNRLMTLIKVASIKSQPPKKMSRSEAMSQQKALNAARRARMGSRG